MSPVQNCLNRYLLFPNICGSFLFNLNGQLIHTRVIRIILSLVSYACCLYFYDGAPSTINFHYLIRLSQNFLICCATGMLLRPSWLIQDFRKSLELIERLSGFVNGTEIKLIFWPSIVSNVVIFSAVSYKAYKFSIPTFFSLSHLYILVLLNAFADEFSTILLLLRFLSEALNTHLTTVINRESLISMLKAHNMLCLAVGHINNLYSVQILLSVALSFVCCILFTHLLIKEILLAQIDSFTLFLWIFAYLQLSLKIILSASALANSVI